MPRKLFAFDVDGTLISDPKNDKIATSVKSIIKKIRKQGHIVCIFTGRPWEISKHLYQELELDTIIVNSNGAHIHHPSDEKFMPIIHEISLPAITQIYEDQELQKIMLNMFVTGRSYVHVEKKEEQELIDPSIQIEKQIKITTPINFNKMDSNPLGVWVKIKPEHSANIKNICSYFNAKYGDLVDFNYWFFGNDKPTILEITSLLGHKETALITVARQYKISMNDTIAFGDGFNDIGMLKQAAIGVAMANAREEVKINANIVTKFSNEEGGIAHFINWYLNGGKKEIKKTKYYIKKN